MVKASTGRGTTAGVKPAPPAARKTAKPATVAPRQRASTKQEAAKKLPAKGAAPKLSRGAAKSTGAKAPAPAKSASLKKPVSNKAGSTKAGSNRPGSNKIGASRIGASKAGASKGGVRDARSIQTGAGRSGVKKVALTGQVSRSKQLAEGKSTSPKDLAAKRSADAVRTAAKTVAAKKASPRRPVVRTVAPAPAPRRSRTSAAVQRKTLASTPRKAPAGALRNGSAVAQQHDAPPPAQPDDAARHGVTSHSASQEFSVSHLNQDDFKIDGLRTYARYRDLGMAAATGGLCQAHVIRFTPPCTDEVRKRHAHQADLQLIYVLQGWMKNEFEGHGEQMMSAGSCWLQPAGIKHTVLDYSADCEVLEIIVPADFKTNEVM